MISAPIPNPRVYLAGPDVFFSHAGKCLQQKSGLCRDLGLEPLLPVDDAFPDRIPPRDQARYIFNGNLQRLRQAQGLLANMTAFRGPHMDPGTAFEIGYFVAMGLPVACYCDTPGLLVDRVRTWAGGGLVMDGESLRDGQGCLVENFGLTDNLMIEAALMGQEDPRLRTCFDSFTAAAQAMREHLGSRTQGFMET